MWDEKRTGYRNSRIMDGHRPGIRVSNATDGWKNGARYESRPGGRKKVWEMRRGGVVVAREMGNLTGNEENRTGGGRQRWARQSRGPKHDVDGGSTLNRTDCGI